MATGYGYVRDKEPLSINWAEISKGFNDRLKEAEAERQSKRDDIQKQYDELSQQLINKPTGADTDLNYAISSFSTQAAQSSLDALNKLKRGEMTEQEYYNRRANLKSSTSNLFLYAKNFNNQLEENLKLIQSQDPNNQGSGRMAFQMALAQDMLNFKNTVAVIDPATDEVVLVKTDAEGNPTNELVNVSQLGYLSTSKEKSYNYKDKIKNVLKNRGVAKYETKDGDMVKTIQGVTIDPKTATATIDSLAESMVGDESQILSILYQNGYQYTQDESLKGKDGYIYYDIKNNTYDYNKQNAVDIIKEEINNSIPVEITPEKGLTPYQMESLQLQREAGRRAERGLEIQEQRMRQTKEEDEPVAYESGVSQFIDNEGNPVRSSSFVKKIDTDSFSDDKIIDTKENFDALFEMQDYKGATINPVKKSFGIQDVVESFSGGGTGGAGTKTVKKEVIKDAVEIFVPEYMDKPLAIPQSEIIGKNLHEVIKVIDKARREKRKVNEVEFETIFGKDIYSEFNAKKTGSMSDFN
jgi:hypothetical protein